MTLLDNVKGRLRHGATEGEEEATEGEGEEAAKVKAPDEDAPTSDP